MKFNEELYWAIPIYQNSDVVPSLRGIKQNIKIIHPSTDVIYFILFPQALINFRWQYLVIKKLIKDFY